MPVCVQSLSDQLPQPSPDRPLEERGPYLPTFLLVAALQPEAGRWVGRHEHQVNCGITKASPQLFPTEALEEKIKIKRGNRDLHTAVWIDCFYLFDKREGYYSLVVSVVSDPRPNCSIWWIVLERRFLMLCLYSWTPNFLYSHRWTHSKILRKKAADGYGREGVSVSLPV